MSRTNILVIFPQQFFRIFLPTKNNKLYIFSCVVIFHFLCTLLRFEVECMGSLKVYHVKETWVFTGQIDRLMAVRLTASTTFPKINLKRSISIPNSPNAIFDVESLLETLAHSPFFWSIQCLNYCVVICLLHYTFNRKNSRIICPSNHFNKLTVVSSIADLQLYVACFEERVKFLLHPRGCVIMWMNRKTWLFFKLQRCC